ncbi:C4-dicarboxylate ABC transporter [Ectothiorhodospiraceae bacterium WFHF3C12]|nr:C4-dicarboxylate ABC transporter [Ectothiorhodospiraceae bacterium WFHF3C12]
MITIPIHRPIARTLAMISFLVATAPDVAAEPTRWPVQLDTPTAVPVLGSGATMLARRLERMSGGDIQLSLRPTDMTAGDIPRAVADGSVAAGYTRIGRSAGQVTAANLFDAVPFGPDPAVFMAWYYEGPGHDLLQEVQANRGLDVRTLLCGLAGPESAGWFAAPVEAVEDLDGTRGRFGGLGGEILKRLGMQIVPLPPEDVPAAAESGDLQATELSLPAVDLHTGIHEQLRYNLYPGWQQPFTAQYLLINGNRWREIAPARQTMVRTACEAVTARSLAQSTHARGGALDALRETGASLQRLPDAVLERLRETSRTVLEAHAKRDPEFRRVLESQRAFGEQYRSNEALAY